MTDNPSTSRILTLVFTDLVGSTALKVRRGDFPVGELIAQHREQVQRLASDSLGRIIDWAGDGCFLTFETPSAAVRFALSLQQVHEQAPDLPDVRVGMHMGEVSERMGPDGDSAHPRIEGLAVDLAARLCALAQPMQVLMSPGVAESARQRLHRDTFAQPIRWQNHGGQALKGFDVPIEVCEASVEVEAHSATSVSSSAERVVISNDLHGQQTSDRFYLGERLITPSANEIDGVRVETKAMEVLVALVEAAPGVLSAADLLDRVWQNVVVVDNVVHQSISLLRKALGDDARAARYVESIPRRGYRLIAAVTRQVLFVRDEHARDPFAAPAQLGTSNEEFGQRTSEASQGIQLRAPRALGNLPTEATSFVGRDAEIVELLGLLRQHRLVTLTGVGGVGKTRLALRIAADLASTFSDGMWLVELAPVGDPAAVPDAIATALGITPQPGRSVSEAISDALSGRRPLLVLDNCEHVLDAAADFVETLLARTETVTVIATSREGLRVTGEHSWPVPSLDVRGGVDSSAVQLFVERAQAVKPGFKLADRVAAETVTNICQRLDGIALAIELAAARMVSMNPQELLARLTDRFRLLSGARRGLERHQTLRHAVQWSYDLLTEDERTVLNHCAVFAGGFDLASATHICGGNDFDEYATLDLLDSLVRKSLVTTEQVEGRTRYGLLETIRQFSEEQLATTGTMDRLRDRHARYFADQVSARLENLWDGPRQREAVDWADVEFANLRTGFRWSADKSDVDTAVDIAADTATILGGLNRNEPLGWVHEILDAATVAEVRQLPRLLRAGTNSMYVGRLDVGAACAEKLISLLDNPRYDARYRFWSEIQAAQALVWAGAGVETAIPVFTSVAAQTGVARVVGSAWLLCYLPLCGRTEEARVIGEDAMTAIWNHGNPLVICVASVGYGRAFAKTDPGRAMAMLRRALACAREHRVAMGEALICEVGAALEGRLGNFEQALALFDSAIQSDQLAGSLVRLSNDLRGLAALLGRMEQWETAARILGGSRAVSEAPMGITDVDSDLPPVLDDLQSALGTQRFDECVAIGAATNPGAAVHYARQQIQLARDKLAAAS